MFKPRNFSLKPATGVTEEDSTKEESHRESSHSQSVTVTQSSHGNSGSNSHSEVMFHPAMVPSSSHVQLPQQPSTALVRLSSNNTNSSIPHGPVPGPPPISIANQSTTVTPAL